MVKAQTSARSPRAKKWILGLAGFSAAAVMGTAGVAAAQSATATLPTSKADCANWQALGFKNHGQCVKAWNQLQHGGSGYGNTTNNVSGTVNIENNGDNNVFNVAFNYVFGN
jgi:hypothetical protein